MSSGRIFILALIISFASTAMYAQSSFSFTNPSFEGIPGASSMPMGWYDCGQIGQTPPDTHPSNAFQVTQTAQHGETYLGMVARDNDTWEAVGQKLKKTLNGGKCYKFSIHLARSDSYYSMSLAQNKEIDFNKPIVLRVWGGDNLGQRRELLHETEVIQHSSWKKYEIKMSPAREVRYIMLEAFYKIPTLLSYPGNILMDNSSVIVSCDEEIPEESKPIAKANPPVNVSPVKPRTKPVVKPPRPSTTPPVVSEPDEKIFDLDIKVGEIIKIEKLYFDVDESEPLQESFKILDELFEYLNNNKGIKIEIRGHTNGVPSHEYCDKLSTERALSVANYLIQKGIDKDRLVPKGYGKREPVATNKTKEGKSKNQRVEIKVLEKQLKG